MILKISTIILTLLFIGVMFGNLSHHSNAESHAGKSDCSFMLVGENVCSMNVFEHVEVWQAIFLAIIPSFILLLVAFAVAVKVFKSIKRIPIINRIAKEYLLPKDIAEQIYLYSYRALQEMFSQGILHPKLF